MFSLLKPIIYVQISPERLTVKNVKSGEVISEVPEIAISAAPKIKILGVGTQARSSIANIAAKVINPFAHPRSLVSDFTIGEQLLKAFLRRLQENSFFVFSPVLVMHPLGTPAGGFTQIENRAFRDMAIGAGASEVILWQGRNLTDEEIIARRFPVDGGILE